MKETARKSMIIAAMAILVLMSPVLVSVIGVRTPGIEEAHAGESIDLSDIIQGVNTDGTVDPGATVSVSMADLESKRSGIKEHYENGEVSIKWLMGTTFDSSREVGSYQDGIFIVKPTLKDAAQKIWLQTNFVASSGFDDSSYNLNSEQYPIYSGTINIVSGPGFGKAYWTKINPIVKSFTFEINNPYLQYICEDSGKEYTSYDDIYIRLERGSKSKIIDDQKLTGSSVKFKNVTLKIGKNESFTTRLYFYYGPQELSIVFPFTASAEKLSKNYTYATKISNNMAIVRWTGISGASGYYVYQGSKRVKKVKASVRKVTIKRKNAGKAKFKVIPFVKSSGKIVKGKSTKMKAKSNSFSTNVSTNYKNYSYGKGQVVLKNVKSSGRKYTITCYAINNRIFKLQKYRKITVKIYADGKCVASKTVKNLNVNMKPNSSKKLTFTVKKGKYGDLRHGTVSYSLSYDPYWGPNMPSW